MHVWGATLKTENRPLSYIYKMDENAAFQTSFIGDSFTLVEHKKESVLLFNNKLFNVIVD